MTEAMQNLVIDAFIIACLGSIPVVLGLGLGLLHKLVIDLRQSFHI